MGKMIIFLFTDNHKELKHTWLSIPFPVYSSPCSLKNAASSPPGIKILGIFAIRFSLNHSGFSLWKRSQFSARYSLMSFSMCFQMSLFFEKTIILASSFP